MLQTIQTQMQTATAELLAAAKLTPGDILVVGCSTSEVAGHQIGTTPGPDIAAALLAGLLPQLEGAGVYLAAQCCEHLGRALVIEAAALRAHGLRQVNAIPQPKAGGSFATAAWQTLQSPVLAEHVCAKAGFDIGGTLIGMHLDEVAVPLRLSLRRIGEAGLVAARTRLKFVGGERAVYDPNLL